MALLLAGCKDSGDAEAVTGPAASVAATLSAAVPGPDQGPRHAYVVLSSTQPDLDWAVADHARRARALGLIPIVHMATMWNSGLRLAPLIDDPLVVAAREGLYLVEISYNDVCLAGGCGRWATDVLCGTFAQTLYEVGPNGAQTDLRASPGKYGPETAEENAAMLRAFKALLANPPIKQELSEARPCLPL